MQQFAELGLRVEADEETEDRDLIGVWDVNWRALIAFLGCETQWRAVGTMAGLFWLGLDYASAGPLFRRRRRAAERRLLDDIRVMEAEALPILNERDE